MKTNLLLSLSLIFVCFFCSAQEKVSENNLSPQLIKTFSEKYPEVKNAEWFMLNDTVLEARFSSDRNKMTVAFSEDGKFLLESSEMAPRETPGMISNYLRGNHPDETVNIAFMREDASGSISYYLEISRPGISQDVTKLYFDFHGNLTQVIKPVAIVHEEDTVEFDDIEDAISVGEPIGRRELPSKVTSFLNDKYPNHRFDSAVFIEIEEHGLVYEIKMRRQGYREYIHVYFDLFGNFIIDK